MESPQVSEQPSGNGFFSRFSTNDLRNLFVILCFLASGILAWASLSNTVARINETLSETVEAQKAMQSKITDMDSYGTIAYKQHVNETRAAMAKLEALDGRTVELLVKLNSLETSLNELKAFNGIRRND